MGHSNVKKATCVTIEKYYTRPRSDFRINKGIYEEVAIIPSKKLRNKIAGQVTTNEAEAGRSWEWCFYQVAGRGKRRGLYVPEVSVPDQTPKVDWERLRYLDCGTLSNLYATQSTAGINLNQLQPSESVL